MSLMKRKTFASFIALGVVVLTLLVSMTACETTTVGVEATQQAIGIRPLLQNQPVPDLGGWSFPRQVVIDTYVATNKIVGTYTYELLPYTGQILFICSSLGYPVMGGTQLTNPMARDTNSQYAVSVGNPEPNGLYAPSSGAGTLITCVSKDGTASPVYWEDNVFALSYPISYTMKLEPLDGFEPSIKIDTTNIQK
jgi:hypothetical protein